MDKCTTRFLALPTLALLSISFSQTAFAVETDSSILRGRAEFQEHCAICHGKNAKGDGPFTPILVYKPADLTKLASKNGNSFPFLGTYLTIDGQAIQRYHGTTVMPIWGERYREESWADVSPEYAETLVSGRIFELVLYLFSIQEKDTAQTSIPK